MNPTLIPETLAAGLEHAINTVVALDPETQRRLAALSGRIVALELGALVPTLFLVPTEHGLQVLTRFDGEPDTRISGTPLGLLRMGAGSREGLFGGDVRIEGDVELGQRFQRILDGLDVDWEEQLSRLTGDVVAHQVGNVVRGATDWMRSAGNTLARDAGEYLQEETELLPGRGEVGYFLDEVDRIRADVDRLAARIKRLEKGR